jgi:hypothetical protein
MKQDDETKKPFPDRNYKSAVDAENVYAASDSRNNSIRKS